MSDIRLQRVLARAGVASRRGAEDLIRAGRVRVDGRVAALGTSVDPVRQRVTLDGRALPPARRAWFALHKPVGYVVSRRDPQGRRTVFDLVPSVPGLTYVGRLDVLTSGLLLLTTDGDAAHRLTHPRFAVPRTYRLRVQGTGPEEVRAAFNRPLVLDGRRVALRSARVRAAGRAVEVELTLTEGRNRVVRRMAETVGLTVESLQRIRYGPVRLGRLAPGAHRPLSERERSALTRPAPAPRARSER